MLKRSTMFALAAFPVLGLAAVSTTDAAARPGQGGGAFHYGGGYRSHFGFRPFWRPWYPSYRPYWRPWYRPFWRPWYSSYRPFYSPYGRGPYGGSSVGGGSVGGGSAAPAMASAPVGQGQTSGGCLTETHLQDGSTLFRNVCTNEAAITTPGQTAGVPQGSQGQQH